MGTRPKCYDEYKKVPYQEEECNAEYVRECPKVWEVQQGAKVWVPETEKCVNESYQKCDKVPKQNCRYETRNECKNERSTQCKDVPKQECKDVHFSVPKQVQKEVCE